MCNCDGGGGGSAKKPFSIENIYQQKTSKNSIKLLILKTKITTLKLYSTAVNQCQKWAIFCSDGTFLAHILSNFRLIIKKPKLNIVFV